MCDRAFHLSRYGTKAPETDDTRRVQSAIDDAHKAGGGKVVIPAGEYPCGPLEMKSGVHLFLEEGARILGVWRDCDRPFKALIHASGARDIRISGPGVIDARGDLETFPDRKGNRPRGLSIHDCGNVAVKDIHFRNSPSWALVFSLCQDLTVDNVTVLDHNNYNNDGIDIVDCSRVKITNCDISSDDDGICLKSFTERGNRDIEIAHCTVGSHCNAIKTGTESYGAFRDVHIHDCKVVRARSEQVWYGNANGQSAICITNVDGAALEDIHIHDIEIVSGTRIPIFLKLGARLRKYGNEAPRPVGVYRRVTVERVHSPNSLNSSYACAVAGVKDNGQTHFLEDIALRDIRLHFIEATEGNTNATAADTVAENPAAYPHPNMLGDLPAYGLYCRHVKGLQLKNIRLSCDGAERRPPIVHQDVHGLSLEEINAWYDPRHCEQPVREVGGGGDSG